MGRRPSEPWTLANEARKLWQVTFTGEYIGDGRDLKEAKSFLETNPDFLEREDWQEVVKARWKRYILSPFWKQQDFPVYAFYMQFRKWAAPIEQRSTKQAPQVRMVKCPDCCAVGVESIHSEKEYCPVCASKVSHGDRQ